MSKMSRRSFLKAFGVGVAGVAVVRQLPELPAATTLPDDDFETSPTVEKDFRVYFGGRRSGKTTQMVKLAVERMWEGDNVIFLSPNHLMGLYAMEMALSQLYKANRDFTHVRSDRAILKGYTNNIRGAIVFRDDPLKLRGLSPDTVIIDEIGMFGKKQIEYCVLPTNPDRLYVSYDETYAKVDALRLKDFYSGAWDTYWLDEITT